MMNKKVHQKAPQQNDNVFTSQGIVTSAVREKEPLHITSRTGVRGRSYVKPGDDSRKTTLVPFNFVKAKIAKHSSTVNEEVSSFPVFYYYPKSRCLCSALSERNPEESPQSKRKAVSQSKLGKIDRHKNVRSN
jgi:hypothetical protein